MRAGCPGSAIALLLAVFCLSGHAGEPGAAEGSPAGWRLGLESSPYLQLHAENPVAWYPWGEAAFAKARRENKPLFISIGYFSCHWCHVMARESFSDPGIARLLNAHFVAIKIDREQRPDVDAAYMRYVSLTRGQGGWPMSVWATPEGEPFFGGTYFPPQARHGRPGFRELLARLAELWTEDEAGIRKTAAQAVAALSQSSGSIAPVGRLSADTLAQARRQLAASYDELQGGFGPAPKFPQPAKLLFLLQDSQQASADMALYTLQRMAAGGIHDQLGGGFHRYSTDFEWRVPHFEKMLYDQALIARACLYAWRRTREKPYADLARETLDFTLREMRGTEGGFYSALGAESPVTAGGDGHPEEGAYYTWSWQQLTDVLGDGSLREWAAARYGASERGESRADLAGRNVLQAALGVQELAQEFDVDIATAERRNQEVATRLLSARDRRPAPPVDDKVVTAWNGYMITTLALAGDLLDEPRYIAAAESAAGHVLERLYDEDTGTLFRDWRDGVRGVPGFSDDYAALAQGLLGLYRVTDDKSRLLQARRLTDGLVENFHDAAGGGFFRTRAGTELWVREKPLVDGASLSANGIAIQVLLGLAAVTGQADYRDTARHAAAWAAARLGDEPAAMSYTLLAWPELLAENAMRK
ncbi:MAG: thioredoxin domain-containing protein [Gammaproteobacteria bacterium]|jgi:hypothetical protein